MENIDKGLVVTKWVLINWAPQMTQNVSAEIFHRTAPSKKKIFSMAEVVLHILQTHKKEGG